MLLHRLRTDVETRIVAGPVTIWLRRDRKRGDVIVGIDAPDLPIEVAPATPTLIANDNVVLSADVLLDLAGPSLLRDPRDP